MNETNRNYVVLVNGIPIGPYTEDEAYCAKCLAIEEHASYGDFKAVVKIEMISRRYIVD